MPICNASHYSFRTDLHVDVCLHHHINAFDAQSISKKNRMFGNTVSNFPHSWNNIILIVSWTSKKSAHSFFLLLLACIHCIQCALWKSHSLISVCLVVRSFTQTHTLALISSFFSHRCRRREQQLRFIYG